MAASVLDNPYGFGDEPAISRFSWGIRSWSEQMQKNASALDDGRRHFVSSMGLVSDLM